MKLSCSMMINMVIFLFITKEILEIFTLVVKFFIYE